MLWETRRGSCGGGEATGQLNGTRRVGLPWQSLAAFPRIAMHAAHRSRSGSSA